MNHNGSDKGAGWHNYTKVYAQLFSNIEVRHMFELGIGSTNEEVPFNMGSRGTKGASLKAWKQYFSAAKIYGADIDRETLFQEDRILTLWCDQLDTKSVQNMFESPELPKYFDVIIDDGFHDIEANIGFMNVALPKLKKGGVYVVEDVKGAQLGSWHGIMPDLMNRFPGFAFRICSIPNIFNALDNHLVIVYRQI